MPFIDRPVHVETLASAAVEGLLDSSVRGVQDWKKMEDLSERRKVNKPKRTGAKLASGAASVTAGGGEL